MRLIPPWWRTVARWLVLWPLWERQRWPQAAKIAAAATTGVIGLVLLVVIASAVGSGGGREPSEQVQQPPASSPSPAPTFTALPTPTPSYTLPAGAECIPAHPPEAATMVRVVDGDTIEVSVDGRTATVRYIGVNTPEQGQPYYQEATDANRRLLGDGRLLLYKDVSETDGYGRLLRYVVAGDRFVNLELVKAGYAQAATYPPDVACSQAFVAAEREARSSQVGLWAPAPVASQPTPTQAPSPAPASVASQPTPTQAPLPAPVASQPTPTPSPATGPSQPQPPGGSEQRCDPSYPTVCIPPPPPDLDCGDIPYRNFVVKPPDPHRFDRNRDGIGCEE